MQKVYIKTPIEKAHTHFYDYIQDFPGAPQYPDFESSKVTLQAQLRHQFINQNHEQVQYLITARNCFKFAESKYIDFCLDSKLGKDRKSTQEIGTYLGISNKIKQSNNYDQIRMKDWGMDAQQKQTIESHH